MTSSQPCTARASVRAMITKGATTIVPLRSIARSRVVAGDWLPSRCMPKFFRAIRCSFSLAQQRRETLHVLERVDLGDERGEALGPLPPEHGIDQQVEFVGDFVQRHRVFRGPFWTWDIVLNGATVTQA